MSENEVNNLAIEASRNIRDLTERQFYDPSRVPRYWVRVFGREVEVKHERTQRLLAWLMLHITGSCSTTTETP